MLAAALAGAPATAADGLGSEPYRPAYHYSPQQNWMNDPNGLVYRDGTYHLYYQHNPLGNTWGNMSWGHATSTDLMHWTEQPLALSFDDQEDVFSGSVVVDEANASGLGTPGNPPLVAVYTSAYKPGSPYAGRQAQSLAYSTDGGTTWTKYAGNPVLDRGSANFRDPKVFRYEGPAGSYWVMAAVEAQEHKVLLYRSDNLLDWTPLSEFGPANAAGGLWECPDLFPLAVDGDPANVKWVLVVNVNPGAVAGGSGGQYFVGSFDGVTFTSESTRAADALPEGRRLSGFDAGTYEGWSVANEPGNASGGPFASAPAAGTLPGQNAVSGFVGPGLVNSFTGNDWPLGRMESPQFTLDEPYLNFFVGGGQHPRVSDKLDNIPPAGQLLFDGFESGTLEAGGWTGTGDLVPAEQPVDRGGDYYLGAWRVNTFEAPTGAGDDRQGTLTSPSFAITHRNLAMLVGGGRRDAASGQVLEVQLLVDGQVVRRAAGEEAGALNWKGWDVAEFAGRQAQLRVVDQATGGWGHLTLDHVVLTDEAVVPRSDETTVNLVVDGQVVRTATGANSEVLDWASWDVREFAGRQASLRIVDNSRFGWGHVLADEFRLGPAPATPRLQQYDWLDWGRDYYAAVSFNNAPDGRRIMLGWMNNWDYANQIPTSPWRSAMALPREVALASTPEGPKLVQRPVAEADALGASPSYKLARTDVTGTRELPSAAHGQVQRLDVVLTPGSAQRTGVTVHSDGATGTVVGYDRGTGRVFVDRRRSGDVGFSPLFPSFESVPVQLAADGTLELSIYLDRSSVEVFAQGGRASITDQVFPAAGADGVSLFAEGGTARVVSFTATPLASSMFAAGGALRAQGRPVVER